MCIDQQFVFIIFACMPTAKRCHFTLTGSKTGKITTNVKEGPKPRTGPYFTSAVLRGIAITGPLTDGTLGHRNWQL